MATIKNTSDGPRGFHAASGEVLLDKGQSWTGDITDAERKSAEGTGYFTFGDADDGPVSLAGKNKAQLLDIAREEGVEVADDATNAQIVEAIEASRAA